MLSLQFQTMRRCKLRFLLSRLNSQRRGLHQEFREGDLVTFHAALRLGNSSGTLSEHRVGTGRTIGGVQQLLTGAEFEGEQRESTTQTAAMDQQQSIQVQWRTVRSAWDTLEM